MKNLTKTEKKTAIRIVFYAINENVLLGKFEAREIFKTIYQINDMRTRVGKFAVEYFANIVKEGFNPYAYRALKQKRAQAKTRGVHPTHWLASNHLFVDYRANKKQLKCVEGNRLNFYGRYHYARTEQDFKVLEIIRKHNGTK